MKEENSELEQLRAFTFGMQSAFIAALGAIIRTHPDPVALSQSLHFCRQIEQTYLENSPFPENALDSFHHLLKRLEVDIPIALQSHHSQPPAQE
jgi:hypothetical protein